jgi:hypothetical protein
MENPEQRPFKEGFLDDIFADRAKLLAAALTIWRWGRLNAGTLQMGLAIGSYEVWAQWCRDPIFTLGLKDPISRLAQIKQRP